MAAHGEMQPARASMAWGGTTSRGGDGVRERCDEREGLAPRSDDSVRPSVGRLASASCSLHHRRRLERGAGASDTFIGHGEGDKPGGGI